MTLTTAGTLYVGNGSLAAGTYTVTNSTSADSYIYFNDATGYITTAKITAGTSGSVTLSRACTKVAAHGSVNSLTVSVGTSPTSITATAVSGGTLDTVTTTTNTYAPAAGWAFVFAVGAASGPVGGDTQFNSYGGSGGYGGLHDGIYTYLNGGNYNVTIGAAGTSGGVFTAGNAGGTTSFGAGPDLSVIGSRYDGIPIAGNRGWAPGGGGGNSWTATPPANPSTSVYAFAKTGTNSGGGGGAPGYGGPGKGSGIGTGGFNGNAASGYGAGGGGGNQGAVYGGASTGGVVYILRGIQ
jgi:hypothetical protein